MRYCRLISLLATAALLLCGAAAGASIALPASLTAVEAEAFMGDAAVEGLVAIPAGVTSVGTDAFTGTALYALELPASVTQVGAQRSLDAAYVRVHGAQTRLDGLECVRCVIAPADSPAQRWAEDAGNVRYVPEDALLRQGGFYYQKAGGALTLLCAVDAEKVGQSAVIPATIDNLPVTAATDFSFQGCDALASLVLPTALQEGASLPEGVSVEYTDAEAGVLNLTVRARAGDDPAEGVTWTVAGFEAEDGDLYEYTLTLDGAVVDTSRTSAADYVAALTEPGEYQLEVQVSRDGALVARGVSPKLFIAAQALTLNAPRTLHDGQNLSVEVPPLDGALSYSVLLTREDTGESLGTRTLPAAGGTARFSGHMLTPGEYRITGYVYGNSYAMSVPTVARLTVDDIPRAACPEVRVPESVAAYRDVRISLTGGDYQIIEPTGGGSSGWGSAYPSDAMPTALLRVKCQAPEGGSGAHAPYPDGDIAQYGDSYTISRPQEGERYALQFALCVDGQWSDWSPEYAMAVTAVPPVPDPVVTFIDRETGNPVPQAELVAGRETEIRVSAGMMVGITMPTLYYKHADIWERVSTNGSGGGPDYTSVTVLARELAPGDYRLEATLQPWGPYYAVPENGLFVMEFTVSGEGVALPELTVDKTEAYLTDDSVTLNIHTEGGQSASIETRLVTAEGTRHYGGTTRSLDEDGNAVYRDSTSYSDVEGEVTLVFRVSVSRDGVWGPYACASVPLRPRPRLAPPQVTLDAQSVPAGQDLTIRFASVADATQYGASVINDDGSNREVYYWNGPILPDAPLTLPGYALGKGRYRVRVTTYADGYRSNTGEAAFTVSGSKPAFPGFASCPEEIRINENVAFTVATGEVEAVRVWSGWDDGQGVNPTYTENNTQAATLADGAYAYTERISSSAEGRTRVFRFAAKQNGVWSNWTERRYVVQGLPQLSQPVIDCESSYPGGADVTVAFQEVPNAQSYDFRLYYPDGTSSGTDYTAPASCTYEGYRLEPGSYRVTVEAYANGYISSTAEATFTVGEKPAAPSVQVDKTALASGEKATFTISCPGAEALVAKTRNGYTDYININVFEDPTLWTVSGYGSYAFAALADGRWSAWSAPIEVTGAPTPSQTSQTAPTIDAPGVIRRGQDLVVSAWAEDARYCDIDLYNAQGNRVYEKYVYDSQPVTLPGYLMAVGDMELRAEAYGANGRSTETEATVRVEFAEQPPTPDIRALNRTESVGIPYAFEVPTAGADRVAVRYYRAGYSNDVYYEDFESEGDLTAWSDENSTVGTVWKYAFARRVDGLWSLWSPVCTVTIAPREALQPVVLGLPEALAAGADATLSFTDPDNMGRSERYRLTVTGPDGSEVYYTGSAQPGRSYTLDGLYLEEGEYTVSVTASASQYDSSTQTAAFTVTGPRADAPEVECDIPEKLYSGQTFTFTVHNVGGTRIAWRSWRDGEAYDSGKVTVREDDTLWERSARAGVWTYRFALLKDGAWSGWSDPVTVEVLEWEPMDLAAPQVGALPEAIAGNADLTVAVTGPGEADSFQVELTDAAGNRVNYSTIYGTGDVTFYGYRQALPLGTLKVTVYDYGPNGSRNQTEQTLQVTAPVSFPAPQVVPPEDNTSDNGNSFTFAVSAEGADKAVARYYRWGAPDDMGYSTFDLDAAGAGAWTRSAGWFGKGTWRVSFAVRVNGLWSDWSPYSGVIVR